jgi:hypothetical protein
MLLHNRPFSLTVSEKEHRCQRQAKNQEEEFMFVRGVGKVSSLMKALTPSHLAQSAMGLISGPDKGSLSQQLRFS